jgi:hypothetical protein
MELNGNIFNDVYICNDCNFIYKTRNGLWKHNHKFHINPVSQSLPSGLPKSPSNIKIKSKIYSCIYCKKSYSNKNSKYKHQKICKLKVDEIKQIEIKLTNKINKLKKELIKNQSNKIINNTIIIKNKIINNIGSENITELNDREITMIFNKELEGIITFIEVLNFNERLPQNHNYCSSSLESKYLSYYNDETDTIDKDRKKYFFDKILTTTIEKMEILYNANTKKFNKIKRKQIEDNILNLKTIKNYHFNNKIVKEIMNKMNLISYNKRDIIYKTWYKSNLKSLDL